MTYRCVTLAIAYIAGVVLATCTRTPVWPPILAAFALAGAAFSARFLADERKWRTPARTFVILAIAIFALPLGYWRAIHVLGPPPPDSLRHVLAKLPPKTHVLLHGPIAAEPDLRANGRNELRLRVTAISVDGAPPVTVSPEDVLLSITSRRDSPPDDAERFRRLTDPDAYGYIIEAETRTFAPRPRLNPDDYNPDNFLLQNGYVARFQTYIRDVRIVAESRGNLLMELALAAKRRFLATYIDTIRAPASRLTAAATLGARRTVEKATFKGLEIVAMFRHAGVGHVLAVSGLHVTVVCLLLYYLFKTAGIPARIFVPPLILFLVLFALLTGARPSSTRAVVMNGIILCALAYFKYDLKNATYIGLSLAATAILVHKPIILYSPGFLLSFGAVLSLVLITPAIDRWIRRLRGAALILAALWLIAFLYLCATDMPTLLQPTVIAGTAALLFALIAAGNALNRRRPALFAIGAERIPATPRMFLAAQLAIQLGMMIPMSAYFFGQFPVAGVVVNLAAIPAIGILVQLGMLTGLMGLLPLIGSTIAAPFGATATVVGTVFFWLAWAGATFFPFPAVPKPTGTWLAAYYLALAAVLTLEYQRPAWQRVLYRYWPRIAPYVRTRRVLAAAPILLLLALPIGRLLPADHRCHTVTCFATREFPVLMLVSDDTRAALVNAGSSFEGERLLFEALRRQGATVVDTALLCGPQPTAGNEGLAALCQKAGLRRCYMPVVSDDPASYLDAVGDTYVAGQARRGKDWAAAYTRAYAQLTYDLEQNRVPFAAFTPGERIHHPPLDATVAPMLEKLPDRYVSSARSAVVTLDTRGFRWTVITDATFQSLKAALPPDATPATDVLVMHDFASRRSYAEMLDLAIQRTRPRAVLITGTRPPPDALPAALKRNHPDITVFATGRDGAVTADFPHPDTLRLQPYLAHAPLILQRHSRDR